LLDKTKSLDSVTTNLTKMPQHISLQIFKQQARAAQ